MKRKSSDEQWQFASAFLSLSMILVLVTFSIKTISASWTFSRVWSQIPLVYESFDDDSPVIHDQDAITSDTPIVLLTESSFLFGDLKAFSEDLMKTDDKYRVDHIKGEPQIGLLIEDIGKWIQQKHGPLNNDILILSPSSNIPLPLVIQTIYWLKKSMYFKRVVIAGGIT